MDVAQRTVEIRQILKRLDRKAFNPTKLGAAILRCRDLIEADVDSANPARRPGSGPTNT